VKIKVLHIIDHLRYGGATIVVKTIAEKIDKGRFETLVCALGTNAQAIPIQAKVINLTYGKYNPFAILAIARLAKEHEIDVIHAHLTKSVITSLMATFIHKAPVIVHEHGPVMREGVDFSIYRLLLRSLRRRAAAIIANSRATARSLVRATGMNAAAVAVIQNTIDFEQFDTLVGTGPRARQQLAISESDIVVGFVGRLHRVKGVDILLRALSLLLQQSHHYLLVIAGDGPDRESLENLATRLGVAERVRFLGMRRNPAEIMAGFDVGVVPSRQEPFGIVALELMRMRVPLISSPVGGLVDIVQDGKTGILLNRLEADCIAGAVKRLAQDRQLRNELAANAHVFSNKFDAKEQLKQLEDIYMTLAGTRAPDSS
jgi:glycosyltransferase involved in cell wall biosynthesis